MQQMLFFLLTATIAAFSTRSLVSTLDGLGDVFIDENENFR